MKARRGRQEHRAPAAERSGLFAIALGLIALATALVYFRACTFAFTNWDDHLYILTNPLVREFSWDKLGSLFTSVDLGNYHPLTMFSYAVEWKLAGPNPHFYHASNIVLHFLNGVLVFWLAWLLFRRLAAALPAALLFVVHPLQVESVAWVAERKNVLVTFFYLAAVIAYMRRSPETAPWRSLGPIFILSGAALLSKGIAVTLPVVFLLVDVHRGRRLDRRAWVEKIPLFVASVAAGLAAVWAQHAVGALRTTRSAWWLDGPFLACRGLVFYVVKTLLPFGLSAIYPYPRHGDGALLPWDYLAAPLAVAAAAAGVLWARRRASDEARRVAVFAGGWFLINIAPVLQLLPIGDAAAADRYAYLPGVGLFLLGGACVGALAHWAGERRRLRLIVVAATTFVILTFGLQAHRRALVWRDGMSLWDDVLARYPGVPAARALRSELYFAAGDDEKGFADLDQGIALNPREGGLIYDRACAWLERGQVDRAAPDLDRAIELNPALMGAYSNRAFIHFNRQEYERALVDYNKVVELAPDDGAGYRNRALTHYYMKRFDLAWADVQRAEAHGSAVDPRLVDAVRSGLEAAGQ